MELTTLQSLGVMPLPFIAAVWIATVASRNYNTDLQAALTRAGVSRKEAAYAMGLSEQQLSDQLAMRVPLNAYRLADLFAAYPAVEDAWIELRAERRGFRLIRDVLMRQLIDAVTVWTVTQRKPKMAKASLPATDNAERIA